MTKQRTYSLYTKEAVALLGEQIKLRRKQNKWTEVNLAERAGISRETLRKIEKGEMSCAIGLVFEVAALVEVPLFDSENFPIGMQREDTQYKIALLPKRMRKKEEAVHDDF